MSGLSNEVMAQNGHPLVEALRPGGPREPEPLVDPFKDEGANNPKVLVQIDDGAYVDPLRVTCVRTVSVGTQGYVRVTLDNGDDFDVRQHECELNQPDASKVQEVVEQLHAGMQAGSR